jgi:hypothetical protein
MPGNMTKAQALEWLLKYGPAVRGYPQEPAAAYVGLGVRSFREGVSAGLLPQPRRHGKRLVWDKIALDKYMDSQVKGPNTALDHDPIMADIYAAQSSSLRTADQG